MEKIKTKIDELLQTIEGYAPINDDQTIFYQIKKLVKRAKQLAEKAGGKSRIKKGGSELAALLNDVYKDERNILAAQEEAKAKEKKEEKPAKKRGRPKKEKENLLATSNNIKKSIKQKLNEK